MPYHCAATLPILGLPIRFEAEDPALLAAALAAYAVWRRVPLSPPDATGVRLRIGWLGDDFTAPAVPVEPTIVVSGCRIGVYAPGLEGTADWVTGDAECRIAGRLAADPQRLASDLLDTLLLFMLTRRNRIPLHAAGIVRNGVAALLCAPSGVGKSTLAMAAVSHGFKLLSDDAVYLESLNAGGVRVWGWPRAVHVARAHIAAEAEAANIAAALPLRFRNGRWKHAHALPGTWADPPVAENGVVVMLERGTGSACARRADAGEAVSALLARLDPGFDVFLGTLAQPLRRLAAGGAWRLTLSSNTDESLLLVAEVIDTCVAAPAARSDG